MLSLGPLYNFGCFTTSLVPAPSNCTATGPTRFISLPQWSRLNPATLPTSPLGSRVKFSPNVGTPHRKGLLKPSGNRRVVSVGLRLPVSITQVKTISR